MRKQIVITLILLIATACVTVVYFKNLNTPDMRTNSIMEVIPDNAAFIFELNNDKSFYDIFNGNKLFAAVAGKQKLGELDTLRQQLLENPLLQQYFEGQNIFISVHPSKENNIDLMLTTSSFNGFETSVFEELSKSPNSNLLITPLEGVKQGYNIYIKALKKRFYVINKDNNIFSGSFSKDLIVQSAGYKNTTNKKSFILLSEQQNANSLANLYINYAQLPPLFDQLFSNKNSDVFKSLRLLPGLAALSLNYRTDALMFNGSTNMQRNETSSYLALFSDQHAVVNHLKDIFPSTTAYSTNYSVSNPLKFGNDLANWQVKTGLESEKKQLFDKIKAETGVNLKTQFNNLLGNEFADVTTRYFEKFAIISVTDGSKLKSLLARVSTMTDENNGQLNYNKIPYFLLGDAFSIFKRPYFTVIDNYLILANSTGELKSFNDIYINRKFLSNSDQYNQFGNLLAARSNVAFYFGFKNSLPILERDMKPEVYNEIKTDETGWKSFYAASIQFSAADKDFYTNFCLKLNTDTTTLRK